ncbi:MAG TPA: hypothetical protein VF472_20835 [Burkholderiaceae bacterium]
MNSMKHLMLAGVLATAGFVVLAPAAMAAQNEPAQTGFVRGTDYAMYQMDQYHADIEHMSQEERSKLMVLQDKLMQMEMDHAAASMKMEMETAKARRDIQMYIYSTHKPRGQDIN